MIQYEKVEDPNDGPGFTLPTEKKEEQNDSMTQSSHSATIETDSAAPTLPSTPSNSTNLPLETLASTSWQGTIYLVRHGQSTVNVQPSIISGQDLAMLTEQGQAQARAAGVYLRDQQMTRCYASDLVRTAFTAALLTSDSGIPVWFDQRLREPHMGVATGQNWNEIKSKHPSPSTFAASWDFAYPEGENRRQVLQRVVSFWNWFFASVPQNERVVIVSHGSIIQLSKGLLTRVADLEQIYHRNPPNCGVTQITLTDGAAKMIEDQSGFLPR